MFRTVMTAPESNTEAETQCVVIMKRDLHIRISQPNLTLLSGLLPNDVNLIVADFDSSIAEQAEALRGARSVFVFPSRFPVELAAACPDLVHVQVFGAGTDTLDKNGLAELGVAVSNNHGSNAPAVAEHTVVLIFALMRKLTEQFAAVHEGLWLRELMRNWLFELEEFTNKTIGIVGLGHIGKALARRLGGWECDLIYHDILDMDPNVERQLKVRRVDFDELLRNSDVVTLHVPLTPLTRFMISGKELRTMKASSLLINTSRGEVVDEPSLIEALTSGIIRGAGLDVVSNEPPERDSPLLSLGNVVVTPHLAGGTVQSVRRSVAFAAENVLRVNGGESPLSVVEPE